MLFTRVDLAELVFGPAISIYAQPVDDILSGMADDEYVFIPGDIFTAAHNRREVPPADLGKIFWIETLQRAQIASLITCGRTAQWIEACGREYGAGALGAFAACCRSLVEATGDSGDALNHVALTIAENAAVVRNELSGNGVGAVSRDLDTALIHFSHGRRVAAGEDAPSYHKAKSTGAYVAVVNDMGLPRAMHFYGALCEVMHPAAPGMAHFYVASDRGFRLSFETEREALKTFVGEHQASLSGLLPLALNPALLTLRVCAAFGLGSVPEALRRMNFDSIPIWKRIAAGLRAAGLPA